MKDIRHTQPVRRRGAALLLVLIALAVSVLLASAFLDSRGGSVPMANGLSSASQARRAANSGLELALATIAADADWVNRHMDGVLANDIDMDGVVVNVELLDLDTNTPPTATTTNLLVHATATSDQVQISSESMVAIDPDDAPLDLEFGEIALLARDEVRLSDQASLVPWLPGQQRQGPADPVIVGTLDGNAEHVRIEHDAIIVDGVTLKQDARAIDSGDLVAGVRLLPESLPSLDRSIPPQPNASQVEDMVIAGEYAGDVDAANIRIPSGNELRITGDSILRSRGQLDIEPGARVVVESGTLVLDADAHLRIRNATIEQSPDTHILLVARKDMSISNSVIAPTDVKIDPLGNTETTDAFTNVRLVDAGEGEPTITINGYTQIMATVFAPESSLTVSGSTVFYGRAMARRIDLTQESVVYAMPDDNMPIGLSATAGPHRAEDSSRLHEVVCTSDRLSPEAMNQIADTLGAPVCANGETIEPTVPEIAEDVVVDSLSDDAYPRRWSRWLNRMANRRGWIRRSWRHH